MFGYCRRQLARFDVGEGHVFQHVSKRRPSGDPHVSQMFGSSLVQRVLWRSAAHGRERTVQGPNYVRNGGLLGRPRQSEAPFGSPLTYDDPGLSK